MSHFSSSNGTLTLTKNITVDETDVVHDGISDKANFVAVYDNDDTSKSIIAIFVADDSNIKQ